MQIQPPDNAARLPQRSIARNPQVGNLRQSCSPASETTSAVEAWSLNGMLSAYSYDRPKFSRFALSLLSALLLFAFQTAIVHADEFCVVTAQHGYIVDEDDEVLETLPAMSVLDLLSESGVWMKVRSAAGTEGWIRTEQLHRSSLFDSINDDNSAQVKEALTIAAAASQSVEDRDWQAAIAQYQNALKALEESFGTANTGYAWLLTYLTSAQLENGNGADAEKSLNQAAAILSQLEETKSLHGADLFNERGIVAQHSGDLESAISNYQEALLISSSKLGMTHSDIRVVSSNLASVYSERGDLELAIKTQRRAKDISTTILPPDAAERAIDCRVLGQYLLAASEYESAKAELLEAKRLLDDSESSSLELAIEVQLDLAQIYYQLNQHAVARRLLKQILTLLDVDGLNGDSEPDNASEFDNQFRRDNCGLALIIVAPLEKSVGRNELAMSYYRKAAELYDGADSHPSIAELLQDAGDLSLELGNVAEAKLLLTRAMQMFVELDGADSATTATLKERLASLPEQNSRMQPGDATGRDADHVMVTSGLGYLLNAEEAVVETVPDCTLLQVLEETDNHFRVRFGRKELLIRKGQVRRGRLLPSADAMTIQDAGPVYDLLVQASDLAKEDKLQQSSDILQVALSMIDSRVGTDDPFYLFVLCKTTVVDTNRGEIALAQKTLNEQQALIKKLERVQHPVLLEVYAAQANLAFAKDDMQTANSILNSMDKLLETLDRKQTSDFRVAASARVILEMQTNQTEAAVSRQEQVLSLSNDLYPAISSERAESLGMLGFLMALQGNVSEGSDLIVEAKSIAEQSRPGKDSVISISFLQAVLLKLQGETKQAKSIFQSIRDKLKNVTTYSQVKKKVSALTELADILYVEKRYEETIDASSEAIAAVDLLKQNPAIDLSTFRRHEIQLYSMLADSYKNLGNDKEAQLNADLAAKLNAEASSSEDKTDSPAAGAPMQALEMQSSGVAEVNSEFPDGSDSEFLRLDQQMLVIEQRTSIHEVEDGPVIADLPQGAHVWSLESSNGWSRIKVPGEQRFGWIDQRHAADLITVMLQSMAADAVRKNEGDPTTMNKIQAVMAQLQQALNLSRSGETNNAVVVLEHGLELGSELLGKDNPLITMVTTELVGKYLNDRQFSRARTLLEDAQPAIKATLGETHPIAALNASRLGSLRLSLGDLKGAEALMRSALDTADSAFGRSDLRTQTMLASHANILLQLGQLDAAETAFKEVLANLTATAETPAPLRANTLSSLGSIAFYRDQFEAAASLYEQSADEFTKLGDDFLAPRGRVLSGLAATAVRTGDLNEVEGLFKQAAADLAANGQDNLEVVAELQHIQGIMAYLSKDLKQAESLINASMITTSDVYGAESMNTAAIASQLGSILVAKGEVIDAMLEFQFARENVFEYVNTTLPDLDVKEQSSFLRLQDKKNLESALSIALLPDFKGLGTASSASWLLNAKNLPHELAARSGQIRRLLTSSDEVQNYESYLAARRRLATMPQGTADTAERSFRNEELKQQTALMEKSLNALPTEVRRQIAVQPGKWIEVDEVQEKLAADETLVEILRMRPTSFDPEQVVKELQAKNRPPEEYVAWIIPPDGSENITVVRLGNADRIDELVRNVLQELTRSFKTISQEGHSNAAKAAIAASQPLAEVIWNPIQRKLGGRTKVVLSPDGELWRAPWTSLPIGEDRLLIEDFEVRLVISGRDLIRQKPTGLELSSALIFADPDYDASASEVAAATNGIRLPEPRFDAQDPDIETNQLRATISQRATRLPGTAAEARAVFQNVKNLFEAEPALCLQALASEEVFRRSRRPHSIMFSTHGFFIPKQLDSELENFGINATLPGQRSETAFESDPLLRCGLLLAGCNSSDGLDTNSDGILLGREIVETDLRGTQLVVLSACETGLGDIADGQGIAGLRQAFQLAGVECVVSTLWSIDDKETSKLIAEFFAELNGGKSRPAALRQAQLTRMTALKQRHSAAHPFFWAAFTVTGSD